MSSLINGADDRSPPRDSAAKVQVTYYDTASAYYAGYYLEGFAQLQLAGEATLAVHNRPPRRLLAALQDHDWQHLLFAMVILRIQSEGHDWYICVDTHDANDVDALSRKGGFHLALLRSVDLYFKVNFNPERIAANPALAPCAAKILPIGQFFPLRTRYAARLALRLLFPPGLFGLRPGTGHDRPYSGYRQDALARARNLRGFLSIDDILSRRRDDRRRDLFFVTSYRANPRHAETMLHRYRVFRRLSDAGLRAMLGFTAHATIPPAYADAQVPRLDQLAYVAAVADSLIVIYLRGMDDCISSKFALAMAVGSAVVGESLSNNRAMLDEYPHLRQQFAYDDTEALIESALALAADPQEARRLGALNAGMFDSHLSPRACANRILDALSGLRRQADPK